jgi:hypothetical protein
MTKYRLEVYPDTAGKWRWRAVSPNGKTLGSSGQGFLQNKVQKETQV